MAAAPPTTPKIAQHVADWRECDDGSCLLHVRWEGEPIYDDERPSDTSYMSATQKKNPLRDIFCVFRLLANYTQLDVSFQIHYVA